MMNKNFRKRLALCAALLWAGMAQGSAQSLSWSPYHELPARRETSALWERFHDKCRRDTARVGKPHPRLEERLRWAEEATEEQKRVIRYILWNMALVEGGTLNMGENGDLPVTVSPFFINRYEVSQDEWYVITGENPSRLRRRDAPVDQIDWFDAVKFAETLTRLSGIPFRLPSEAEWEYAARGGLNTGNHRYAGSDNPEEVARFRNRNRSQNTFVASGVGSKRPNELGLYDMSGNVCEWCADWYDERRPFSSGTKPPASGEEGYKVLRGGSFYTFEKYCTVTFRYGVNPDRWDIDYGMRLAVSLWVAHGAGSTRHERGAPKPQRPHHE